MKFSTIFAPLLATLAIAAPAPAVEARDLTVENVLVGLTSEVKQLTGNLNVTLGGLTPSSTPDQRQAVVVSVNKDLDNISNAIQVATAKIAPAQKRAQPTLGDLPHAVLGQLDGKPIDLAKLLLPLLQELNPAVESVLNTLYLGEVYTSLHPLLNVQLPALVIGLNQLVHGLLQALAPLLRGLGSLVAPLLAGLGL